MPVPSGAGRVRGELGDPPKNEGRCRGRDETTSKKGGVTKVASTAESEYRQQRQTGPSRLLLHQNQDDTTNTAKEGCAGKKLTRAAGRSRQHSGRSGKHGSTSGVPWETMEKCAGGSEIWTLKAADEERECSKSQQNDTSDTDKMQYMWRDDLKLARKSG